MTSEASSELPCLERLHREAFNCLETFPSKIIELNDIVNEYIPESVRNDRRNGSIVGRRPRCQSTLSTVKNYDLASTSEFDVSSYYSLSMCERARSQHGICKRKYQRVRALGGSCARRRPGPLGQLLAFLVSRLAVCTKNIVITPTQFVVDGIISMLFQKHELKSVQCGPSPNWNSSLSTYVTTAKEDNSTIGNLIEIMRPATIQLIAHSTILKRWLQAMACKKVESPSIELANAIRSTETIDCWAYELFFHLKYLQVNRARRTTHKAAESKSSGEDVTLLNLWHRLVQLRNNYIILYETLNNYDKSCDLDSLNGRQE